MSISPTKRTTQTGLIRKLEPHVIAKIAAGEVIGRPYNVIKEMLENSIDAHATNIQILVKDGGLKSISIADNGDGIAKEDMTLICERFATSKLSVFDDLKSIGTFGFRGEALASISQISHVSITTMQRGAAHGYKAYYKDGKLIAKDRSSSAEPVPCAGTPGTQFLVEDLFYNYPLRKTSMSPLDEYAKIYDVVVRYALHFSGVAFNLKKLGENKADVSTKRTNSIQDNIRELFGSSISRDLIPLNLVVGGYTHIKSEPPSSSSAPSSSAIPLLSSMNTSDEPSSPSSSLNPSQLSGSRDANIKFRVSGFVSGPTAATKKNIFILFINDRLVNCAQLKRVLESQYLTVTSKTSVFIYLSLHIEPAKVDVNMHPNKQEVGLEDQAAVIQKIAEYFIGEIDKVSAAQEFLDNTATDRMADITMTPKPSNPIQFTNSTVASTIIRTDAKEGSMDRYLGPKKPITASQFGSSTEEDGSGMSSSLMASNPSGQLTQGSSLFGASISGGTGKIGTSIFGSELSSTAPGLSNKGLMSSTPRELDQEDYSGTNPKKRARTTVEGENQALLERSLMARTGSKPSLRQGRLLTSVQELLDSCIAASSSVITSVLKDSVIVGSVSSRKLLIQSGNTMYLLDMTAFSRELIYQECLQKFGEMKVFELEEPVPIAELVMLALESEIELRQKPSEEPSLVAAAAQQLIVDKRELLSQYYGIMVSEDGFIVALPEIIEGYMPTNLDGLPVFLFNLYSRLSWQDEKDTFDKVARELATLYAIPTEEEPEELKGSSGGPPALVSSEVAWAIEHQILPSLKRRFSPPPTLHQTHAITSVVSTDKLFKIFERC